MNWTKLGIYNFKAEWHHHRDFSLILYGSKLYFSRTLNWNKLWSKTNPKRYKSGKLIYFLLSWVKRSKLRIHWLNSTCKTKRGQWHSKICKNSKIYLLHRSIPNLNVVKTTSSTFPNTNGIKSKNDLCDNVWSTMCVQKWVSTTWAHPVVSLNELTASRKTSVKLLNNLIYWLRFLTIKDWRLNCSRNFWKSCRFWI